MRIVVAETGVAVRPCGAARCADPSAALVRDVWWSRPWASVGARRFPNVPLGCSTPCRHPVPCARIVSHAAQGATMIKSIDPRPIADARKDPHLILIEELSDAALADWYSRTTLAMNRTRRWSLNRGRWRHACRTAHASLVERMLRNAQGTGRCDGCRRESQLVHAIRGRGAELRFEHYCSDCGTHIPDVWFVMTSVRTVI